MATTDDIQIVETAPPARPWWPSVRPGQVVARAERDAPTSGEARTLLWLPIFPLIFFVYPIVWLIETPLSPLSIAIAILGMCAFVALHLWNTSRVIASSTAGSTSRPPWIALAIQLALACGFGFAYGLPWFGLFIKTSGNIGLLLPMRAALRGIAGVAALTIITGLAGGRGTTGTAGMVAITLAVGLVALSVGRMLDTNQRLRAAQVENGRLAVAEAVAEERLRFARDLHDLLGHSLSLIVLKSELAGRLQRVDAERATDEMHDVEGVAREALREVREAVAGYRQPTLATELPGARIMLSAAGITCEVENEDIPDGLPLDADAILAWTVREGVTNVIRYSHARRCTIRVAQTGGITSVEIADDGDGATLSLTGAGKSGNGLAGLAERAAACGGYFQAGPRPTGGFRLFVSLSSNEQ